MKRRPWECKDNNAASVRIMMTDEASAARLHSASIPDNRPILTASGRQKKVDIGLKWSIIIFTYLGSVFRVADDQPRCQAPDTPTTRDLEPTPQGCQRRAICPRRILRSSRPGPGQVRDAAPGAGRRQVGDGCGGEFRFFTTVFLSSVVSFRAGWPGRTGTPQAWSQAGAQAHRRGHDLHGGDTSERTLRSAGGTGRCICSMGCKRAIARCSEPVHERRIADHGQASRTSHCRSLPAAVRARRQGGRRTGTGWP